MRRLRVLAVIVWLSSGGSPEILAQGGPPADPWTQPGNMPLQNNALAMQPAQPDTAVLQLEWPAEFGAPELVTVVPDTVLFGGVAALVLDYRPGVAVPPVDSLIVTEPWATLAATSQPGFWSRLMGRGNESGPDLAALEPPAGARVVLPVHVYRTDPFRVAAGTAVSEVAHVHGRTAGLDETAAIRAPRVFGIALLTLVLMAVVLTLLILLFGWLWNRRKRAGSLLEDWEIPPPAWINASGELSALLAEGYLPRGNGRAFLDGLAAVARGFVADRYLIAAREMTGDEIVRACRVVGYRLELPRRFARLIDGADRRRYDPEPLPVAWCRERAVELFAAMAQVRLLPRFTSVEASRLHRAEQEWARLVEELGTGETTAAAIATVGGNTGEGEGN